MDVFHKKLDLYISHKTATPTIRPFENHQNFAVRMLWATCIAAAGQLWAPHRSSRSFQSGRLRSLRRGWLESPLMILMYMEVSSWENHLGISTFLPLETLEHLLGSMADHPQMGQFGCHVGARYRALENTHLLKHRPQQ